LSCHSCKKVRHLAYCLLPIRSSPWSLCGPLLWSAEASLLAWTVLQMASGHLGGAREIKDLSNIRKWICFHAFIYLFQYKKIII